MTASIRSLLSHYIDYAGLFPPAALDMGPAVAEYVEHQAHPHSWMLSRFVCPVARLDAWVKAVGTQPSAVEPWSLSLLTGGGETCADATAAFDDNMRTLSSFLQRHGDSVNAEVVEVRIPPALLSHPDSTAVRDLTGALIASSLGVPDGPRQIFYEIAFTDGWPETIPRIMQVVAEAHAGSPVVGGAKIRTGGLEAAAFPTAAEVAGFILAAQDAGIPMKATAGLHHPIRRHAAEVNATMHGFLNVFCAASLAAGGNTDREILIRVLETEDAASFRFTEEGVDIEGHRISAAQLAAARAFMVSVGSCSFTEPVQDLEILQLI